MEQDKELKAINEIMAALEDLEDSSRVRAVNYVLLRLGITPNSGQSPSNPQQPNIQNTGAVGTGLPNASPNLDIRTLKEQKQPKTDIHMAVLVAYYLQKFAPETEKKDAIKVADIQKYFNQADYPLPKVPLSALNNAKAYGYLESAGHGLYKLNPVGYNLAAYGLPEKSEKTSPSRRPRKASAKVKKSKKKT